MPTKPTRVAIYLRVSKADGSQETDNQLLQLRAFCERWDGHELVAEYVDRESGTRGWRERKDFDRMFADAARHRFDILLFWALDRFSREGIRKTIAYLQRLDECGVSFESYSEPFLDTDNEESAVPASAVGGSYTGSGRFPSSGTYPASGLNLPLGSAVARQAREALSNPVTQEALRSLSNPVAQEALRSLSNPVAQDALRNLSSPIAQDALRKLSSPIAQEALRNLARLDVQDLLRRSGPFGPTV
jgi:hypothetical protein